MISGFVAQARKSCYTLPLVIAIIQLILAVSLIAAILLQQRGTGLSGAFGGESSVYSTRRGIEKILFVSTVIIAVLFLGFSIARLLL